MALTPEEAAYFSSGGEDTRALAKPAETPPEAEKPEPVAEEAPVKEAAPEAPQAEDDGDHEEGPIPYQRFKKEREKWKAREAEKAKEAADLREWKARLEERLNFAQQQAAQPEPKAEEAKPAEPPSPEEDIFAHLEWQRKKIAELEAKQNTSSEEQKQAQQYEAWKARIGAEEKAFEAKTPDYTKAIDHLKNSRLTELRDVYGLDPTNPQHHAAISRDLHQQAASLAAAAHQRGVSPAEMAYSLAKARGYTPQAAAVAAVADAVTDAKKDEARAASKSLSGTGGNPTGFKSLDELSNMTTKEFVDYRNKHPEVVRRLMGG